MVQGDNPLEVNTEFELEEDVDMSYDELELFCQQLLEKYDMLGKENKKMKNKIDCMLKEKDSFQTRFENVLKENESFKNKIASFEKDNESLKNENVFLLSKLNDLCEGNTSLIGGKTKGSCFA